MLPDRARLFVRPSVSDTLSPSTLFRPLRSGAGRPILLCPKALAEAVGGAVGLEDRTVTLGDRKDSLGGMDGMDRPAGTDIGRSRRRPSGKGCVGVVGVAIVAPREERFDWGTPEVDRFR